MSSNCSDNPGNIGTQAELTTERECDFCGELDEDFYCSKCVDQRIYYAYADARESLIKRGIDPEEAGIEDMYRVSDLPDALDALHKTIELCANAIKYVLDRAQTHKDFHYQLGWGTEAFRRLVLAEAAILGVKPDDLEKVRREQHFPA